MKKVNLIALVILGIMFILMLGSVLNDSGTFDEVAHIPAGFANLTKLDYRLNPEHPPLIKVLAALSAKIFVNPYFPTDNTYWQNDINGQWGEGNTFLYKSGNDADKLLFWARFPIMLVSLLFGWLLFRWTKKRFNSAAAILTLTFYAFSPTVLAHSRYVTTDIGAALGFFLGLSAFIKFLEAPTKKNILLASGAFGIAQLLKFSLIMLVPIYGLILIGWAATRPGLIKPEKIRVFWKLLGKTVLIFLVGLLIIWAVYAVFTWNYPQDRELRDATSLLSTNAFRLGVNLNLALIKNKITRPLGQYAVGVMMANQRVAGGNTDYFLGEVTSKGSHIYFPLMYLLKESLAFHLLTLIALFFAFKKFRRSPLRGAPLKKRFGMWIQNNLVGFSVLIFAGMYWLISIAAPLNIGVRHILPTLPFIYLLVSKNIVEWLHWRPDSAPQSWFGWLRNIYEIYVKSIPRYFILAALLFWLILDTATIYPNFLSYYNELAGGASNGYKIATDSSYDWGQDLKRLRDFVETNNITKINLDYFGGTDPKYYLGDKFEPWWSSRGPAHGWFAVSATLRQGAFGKIGPGFTRTEEDSYNWLKSYQPIARAGYSIFIYKLP